MADGSGGDGHERLGRFRLDRVLGSGGFATVWLAYDEALDASIAIKILAENWAHNDEVTRRFMEEARILWRVESSHIVRVYGVDTTSDGRPYFVMEYADRGNLEERMRNRHASDESYSIDEALTISLDIAHGLVDAQEQGIVHRDLKPSNVLFKTRSAGTENLLLADFGIARSLEAAGATTIAAGTPHYMAPEQTEGRAGLASDVYSAAVILFELLAGRVPFPYNSVGQVVRAQITESAPDIATLRRGVPPLLASALKRGLSAEPEGRQETALEWRADLARASDTTVPEGASADPGATLGPEALAALAGAEATRSAAQVAAGVGAVGPSSGQGSGGPRPPGSAASGGGEGRKKRRRLVMTGVMVAVFLAALLTAISFASSGTASAEVFRVPATAVGAHPFTPSVASHRVATPSDFTFLKPPSTALAAPTKATTPSIPSFLGNIPGLYGGTRQVAECDQSSMVAYLEDNPAKAAAWASVEGIAVDTLPTYVGELTDVVLRVDTRVTNHGYVNGQATTLPEVLQAGTAVLVDRFGVPRARCYCGNPLTPPVALSNVHYGGPSWPGFSPTDEAAVRPGPVVTKLVIVDVQTGMPFLRPSGTGGPSDTDAPVDALAGSPFGGTTSATSPVVGAPASPGAVAGTYTVGNETGSSACTGVYSSAGATYTVSVKGDLLTLDLSGQAVSLPYYPPTATFELSASGSGNSGQAPTVTGRFINGPHRSVRSVLLVPESASCTVTVSGTKPSVASSVPPGSTTPPTTTTTTPTTVPVTTPTTAASPVNITAQGAVSASSTYPGYPASDAVDGNPTTSWFSTGDADGPTSTFTWQGQSDQMITTIFIMGNEDNANPSFQSGYGYGQTEIQVLNSAGTVVFDQTYPGPGNATHDITATVNAVGQTVRLILAQRESSDCGGFSELKIEARPS